MIIDLERFITEGRPYWDELEEALKRLEADPGTSMDLGGVKRFHYLYQRASADLARMSTFSAEPQTRAYLESLVSRAFSEIHETRERRRGMRPVHWFLKVLPRTFRACISAFYLSAALMALGCMFGAAAIYFDPGSKEILMPFEHLKGDPTQRVAREERADKDGMRGQKASFSSYLITHNVKVSILALCLGITWGIGTAVLLFSNGVFLGAVVVDYVMAGEGVFLTGWLLPHGAVEIPAILLAGQAGLVLGGAMIGWGRPLTLKRRLRRVSTDLVTLIFGVGILLVWAGIIEGFFSQYHEPVIPYGVKIGAGMAELALLAAFLWLSGSSERPVPHKTGKS